MLGMKVSVPFSQPPMMLPALVDRGSLLQNMGVPLSCLFCKQVCIGTCGQQAHGLACKFMNTGQGTSGRAAAGSEVSVSGKKESPPSPEQRLLGVPQAAFCWSGSGSARLTPVYTDWQWLSRV